MAISSARVVYGLNAVGAETGPLATGSVALGVPQAVVNFADADVCYSICAQLASSESVTLNVATGTATSTGTVTDADGLDYQGGALPEIATLYGVCLELVSGAAAANDGTLTFPAPVLFWFPEGSSTTSLLGSIVAVASAAGTELFITVIGKSS